MDQWRAVMKHSNESLNFLRYEQCTFFFRCSVSESISFSVCCKGPFSIETIIKRLSCSVDNERSYKPESISTQRETSIVNEDYEANQTNET